MEKYYITSNKVGEFIQRMYNAGIRVDSEPERDRLSLHKPEGGYEFIKVFKQSSLNELCCAFLPIKSHTTNTEQ